MTHDTFFWPFMFVSVNFYIVATIRTHQEIQCRVYAGFFLLMYIFIDTIVVLYTNKL